MLVLKLAKTVDVLRISYVLQNEQYFRSLGECLSLHGIRLKLSDKNFLRFERISMDSAISIGTDYQCWTGVYFKKMNERMSLNGVNRCSRSFISEKRSCSEYIMVCSQISKSFKNMKRWEITSRFIFKKTLYSGGAMQEKMVVAIIFDFQRWGMDPGLLQFENECWYRNNQFITFFFIGHMLLLQQLKRINWSRYHSPVVQSVINWPIGLV